MKILLIATALMTLVGCPKREEAYYCSDSGFRYIKNFDAMAPDFNKLGLPKRCESGGND